MLTKTMAESRFRLLDETEIRAVSGGVVEDDGGITVTGTRPSGQTNFANGYMTMANMQMFQMQGLTAYASDSGDGGGGDVFLEEVDDPNTIVVTAQIAPQPQVAPSPLNFFDMALNVANLGADIVAAFRTFGLELLANGAQVAAGTNQLGNDMTKAFNMPTAEQIQLWLNTGLAGIAPSHVYMLPDANGVMQFDKTLNKISGSYVPYQIAWLHGRGPAIEFR